MNFSFFYPLDPILTRFLVETRFSVHWQSCSALVSAPREEIRGRIGIQ